MPPSEGPDSFVANGPKVLDPGQPAGSYVDRGKPSAFKVTRANRITMEYSTADEFPSVADFTIDLEREINRQIYSAIAGGPSVTTSAMMTETFDRTAFDALLDRCRRLMQSSPFQWHQMMPDDSEILMRSEGKIFMGKKKWNEFSIAQFSGEEAAVRWLTEQKFYDLEKAVAEAEARSRIEFDEWFERRFIPFMMSQKI